MLNRQKTLLELLQRAERPVRRTELTKWAFLLRHEYASGGGNAFYDFVPFQLGPFSFSLYQEIGKLVDQNYVRDDGDNGWTLNPELTFKPPSSDVAADVATVVRQFGNMPIETLLDYVYDGYPKYTVNSERKQLAERPTTDPRVFTMGYEGLSVDAFLNVLIENGVRRLIDVRHNPIARRYGFHKSTLARLTGRLGIDYVHVPELGIHSSQRQSLETMDDRMALFDEYEKTTLSAHDEALNHVAALTSELPSVLVCMESEAKCCHRSRVALRIAKRTSLPIENL